jgi:hypothetical protein
MVTGVPTVFDRMRQIVCGLHGHDNLLQFERDRMFLKCVSCGHESPGWSVADTPRVARVEQETPHRAIARPPLVGVRRVA